MVPRNDERKYDGTIHDKVLGFNRFLTFAINLNDSSLSLSEVRFVLECCDDFSAVGFDGIPSILLHQCANTLRTTVLSLSSLIEFQKTHLGESFGN